MTRAIAFPVVGRLVRLAVGLSVAAVVATLLPPVEAGASLDLLLV